MEITVIVGIAIIGMILTVVLKQYKPEYAVFVSILTGITIILMIIQNIVPLMDEIQSLLSASSMPMEYIEILFKALGICFLTQLACDTCKDAGESSIASKVEMAGKVAVLLMALPLFKQVLNVAVKLITS